MRLRDWLDPLAYPLPSDDALARAIIGVRGGLIVSVQAPDGSPLRSSAIIAGLASAAVRGGATGLRINGPEDIRAVRDAVGEDIPLIGLHKVRGESRNLITVSMDAAADLARAGADIIAAEVTVEAWGRGVGIIARIQGELGLPVMADVSTRDEGLRAWRAGADLVGTTLSGYTPHSPRVEGPDLELVRALADDGVRVVAEGRYRHAAEVAEAKRCGAWSVVVGGAITDAVAITERFALAMSGDAE